MMMGDHVTVHVCTVSSVFIQLQAANASTQLFLHSIHLIFAQRHLQKQHIGFVFLSLILLINIVIGKIRTT